VSGEIVALLAVLVGPAVIVLGVLAAVALALVALSEAVAAEGRLVSRPSADLPL
jgi:hypothetical protein